MPAPEPDLRASFNLPFAEQLEFFRGKVPLDTERWDDIWQGAHDKSFIVAGAKGDLLADLMGAVDKAIEKGTGLEEFRKDFKQQVAKHGWTGWTGEGTPAGEAWRTRVIWETNLRTSYMAGRYAQLTDPDLLARRPYWKYIHSEAVTNPRPQHLAWSGLVLRHDHPFWQTHFPPNGFGCQCRVTSVRAPGPDDATTPPEGWDKVGENGTLPGVGKGWAYAPGRSVAEDLREIVGGKVSVLPAEVGAALAASVAKNAPAMVRATDAAFAEFFDKAYAERDRPQGSMMVVGAMRTQWVEGMAKAGVAPATAEIVTRADDVAHTFRPEKDAPMETNIFRNLPRLLRAPTAVILDTTHARPAPIPLS
ncbi:phage morphogenesis protein [Betaproteobacteria bacterium]|nr:phage morphogenesis protein [Betaproteobacteria bacterium]GHU48628.1 phage morphogenesis protein [Betaproteobacteria bacterium]